MSFHLIDLETWERKEFYNHFMNNVVCSYSITANIDVSALKNEKLYPAMLWLLTQTVNEIKEFRTTLSHEGLGYFENMHPSYTIFNKQNKNFVVIWTEFISEYNLFLKNYDRDVQQYQTSMALSPKQNKPINTFDVSMIPWTTFSSFNINVYNEGKYLLPIFTMGKTFVENEKTMLPLAIQVHHAVCDGYHVSLFIDRLQNKINHWVKGALNWA